MRRKKSITLENGEPVQAQKVEAHKKKLAKKPDVENEVIPASPAAIQQVIDLLKISELPRTARWLRNRLEGEASLRIYSILHHLATGREIDYLRNGTWRPVASNEINVSSKFDPMTLVGPVWEPKVVEALLNAGIPVVQQKHVLSYYLDIAIDCQNGAKLNVEVDGRTHRRYDGRRKSADIIRDAQLRSYGWIVHRIWVKDLMTDFEARINEVIELWKNLGGN